MSSHSKNAWLAFGLCLTAAGTAYAAIPDANGTIRGCYNILTGSARIVDGNSCNLLERSISWAQVGPRGPAGVPGPVGPQGPAGINNTIIGRGIVNLKTPVAPRAHVEGYAVPGEHPFNQTVTPAVDSVCALTVFGTTYDAPGQLSFYPSSIREDGEIVGYGLGALMATGVISLDDTRTLSSASATELIDVRAGHTYKFGVHLQLDDSNYTQDASVNFTLSWTCTPIIYG